MLLLTGTILLVAIRRTFDQSVLRGCAACLAWQQTRRRICSAASGATPKRSAILLRRKFLQVEGPWYWSEQDGPRRQAASWPPHGALVLGGRRDPSALTIVRQRARGIKLLTKMTKPGTSLAGGESVQMLSF